MVERIICSHCERVLGNIHNSRIFVAGSVQIVKKADLYCSFCLRKYTFSPIEPTPKTAENIQYNYCKKCGELLGKTVDKTHFNSGRILIWERCRYSCGLCGKNHSFMPQDPPEESESPESLEILNNLARKGEIKI